MRIQSKFFLYTAGAATLVTAFCGIQMLHGARAYEEDRLFHKTLATEDLLKEIIAGPLVAGDIALAEDYARLFLEDREITRVLLESPDGTPLVDLESETESDSGEVHRPFVIRRGALHLASGEMVFTRARIEARLHDLRMTLMYLASLITLVLAFAYSGIARAFWRPFSTLIGAMRRVDRGDYDVRVDMGDRDEYGEIGQYFNTMVEGIRSGHDQIREYAAELEEKTQRLQREIEEREATEEALRRAQKMEAIARLAGGVAHDFNNLLTSILGFGAMVLEELEDGHPARGDIEEIVRAGERARSLTRQLLALGRRQPLQLGLLDVNNVLRGLDNLLRRTLRSDIELVIAPGAGLGSVRADSGSLEQVVVNLVINARDAMPEGGKIVVATERVELPADPAPRRPNVEGTSCVLLSVADTGTGIPVAVVEQVFEPFFTTKQDGTGLGLSTAYGIVRQCGGDIEVDSRPGEGSVFKIYLPCEDRESDVVPVAEEPAPVGGTETILLVEDEESVRRLTARVLDQLGYTVLQARYGTEGLEVARSRPDGIDLVLTDVVMPHLSGPDMVRRLCDESVDFLVLYMSGYTRDRDLTADASGHPPGLILKPFTRETLARRVRETLDQDV